MNISQCAGPVAQGLPPERIQWSVAATLPPANGQEKQPGIAGPFVGVSHDALLVAGGAAFPGKKPWEGGQKVYMDDIYILQRKGDGYDWRGCHECHLPERLAYGASVTTPNGIVCIGGESATGYSNKVFLMQWDDHNQTLRIKDLPPLPVALASAGVSLMGQTIYVVGGENESQALHSFYAIDLNQSSPEWRQLADLPIDVSHCVAVAQGGSLFVIGGRTRMPSGVSKLHGAVWRYDPRGNSWQRMHDVVDGKETIQLSAASAVPCGKNSILVISGDDGKIFHRLEALNAQIASSKDGPACQRYQEEKLQIINHHPGFRRGILEYDTRHDSWAPAGRLPSYGPVTTTAVIWDGQIFVPCGEIKPGTRTPNILRGKPPVQ